MTPQRNYAANDRQPATGAFRALLDGTEPPPNPHFAIGYARIALMTVESAVRRGDREMALHWLDRVQAELDKASPPEMRRAR